MMPPTPKPLSTWISLFAGLVLLGFGLSILTPFSFGRPVWWLGDIWSMHSIVLIFSGFVTLLFCLIEIARTKRQVIAAVLVVGLVAEFGATRLLGNENAMIQNRFESTRHLRVKAEAYFSKQTSSDQAKRSRAELPGDLKALTYGRKAAILDLEDGSTLVFFCHFTHGIDNSEGLVWSSTGQRPAPISFEQVTKVVRLDSHWFWINTT